MKIYEPIDIRNFPKSTGIYSISFKNSTNKKIYIGSASQKIGFLWKMEKTFKFM